MAAQSISSPSPKSASRRLAVPSSPQPDGVRSSAVTGLGTLFAPLRAWADYPLGAQSRHILFGSMLCSLSLNTAML
jgi:hypothetical protein